jgi:GT2 family glycosyltransferase
MTANDGLQTPDSRPRTLRKENVSIVIPSWNGRELLEKFLPSVIASARHYISQTGAQVEILIVDDGSADDSVSWLIGQGFEEEDRSASTDTSAPELRLFRNPSNLGFGITCNRGLAAAKHNLVFLLNNDVETDLEAIAPMVGHFDRAEVFAVHCRVFEFETGKECGAGKLGSFAKGFIRVHRSFTPSAEPTAPLYSIFASGGSAMFDRRKFLDAGGFDLLLSPAYWEDVELSYRAWKRGWVVIYEPRSVVHHRVSSTMRKLDGNRIRRLQQRNRLIYHWIDLHDYGLFAWHILWTLALALTAPLRLEAGFIVSFFAALGCLREILRRRRQEKLAAKRTDREVFKVFEEMEKRSDLTPFD